MTGGIAVDLANAGGVFGKTDDHRKIFCTNEGAFIHVGDFNNDGTDDIYCRDVRDMILKTDFGVGAHSNDVSISDGSWCRNYRSRMHVGYVNGDDKIDRICHNTETGLIAVDYGPSFSGTNWYGNGGWCNKPGQRVFIGDFNGDDQDDLLCFDRGTGEKRIDHASDKGRYDGTDWVGAANGWCAGLQKKLLVGDFNGDGLDDLLCLDTVSGKREIDWHGNNPSLPSLFGTEWARKDGWCGGSSLRTVY